jgi:hypothetical protein
MASTDNKDTPFELKSTDNAQFSNKCKNIFESLEKLEKNHKEYEKTRGNDEDRTVKKSDPVQGGETETITSAFKAPQAGLRAPRGGGPWRQQRDRTDQWDRDPPPGRGRNMGQPRDGRERDSPWREHQHRRFSGERRRHPYYNHKGNRSQSTPNYKVNPEKWTKYSLEDVGEMSESSNTRAAFAFLEERRKLREGEMKAEAVNTEDTSCSRGVFTFRKPVKRDARKDNANVSSKSVVKLSDSNDDCKGEQESSEMTENSEKTENEKVTFKSVKKSKRNIRSRDHADD